MLCVRCFERSRRDSSSTGTPHAWGDRVSVAAVAAACRHQAQRSPSVTGYAISSDTNEPLSPHECDVARLVALGRSNEVAALVGITAKTVETYPTRVMRNVGAHSVVDLVHYAIDLGLIDIDPSARPTDESSVPGNIPVPKYGAR